MEDPPMLVIGKFLDILFKGHQLPQRSEGCAFRRQSMSRSFMPTDSNQFLHSCLGYNQQQLLQMIVSIYNGVPENFAVFHCRSTSTEEELGLFLKRATKHPLEYLMLEVNRLPFKLQEVSYNVYSINHQCLSEVLKLIIRLNDHTLMYFIAFFANYKCSTEPIPTSYSI